MDLRFLYSQHFYVLLLFEALLLLLTTLLIVQPNFFISEARVKTKRWMMALGWTTLALLFVFSFLLGAAAVLRKISL